jgi:hypothetical protein
VVSDGQQAYSRMTVAHFALPRCICPAHSSGTSPPFLQISALHQDTPGTPNPPADCPCTLPWLETPPLLHTHPSTSHPHPQGGPPTSARLARVLTQRASTSAATSRALDPLLLPPAPALTLVLPMKMPNRGPRAPTSHSRSQAAGVLRWGGRQGAGERVSASVLKGKRHEGGCNSTKCACQSMTSLRPPWVTAPPA